ncbi:MAG: 2-oxoacid:acceptor oxidoreductase family protein [Syntrophaceae bacterium]|nr:2-oxoacid:acceptor oxidoreductase family protein [Syntrophaceae bacterium]
MPAIIQVRLSGFGGQGIVLAGILLGEAGVIEGKYVAGSNSYGAQARGSNCKSEIVFSDGPIDFPHLTKADILLAMSQGAYNLYCEDVKEGSGLILFDQGQVMPREGLHLIEIGVPATEYALKRLKNRQVANIVLLGAFIEITKIVSRKAMEKAIRVHVAERFRSLNLKALQIGIELGRRVHG